MSEHANEAINVFTVLLLAGPTLAGFIAAATFYDTVRCTVPAAGPDGCTPGAVRCNELEWLALSPHHRGMKLTLTLTAMSAAIAVVHAAAQSPSPPGQKLTLSSEMIRGYTVMRRNLLEAAELMPEADYLFKPTPETRPFGQLISHLALSQFDFCSALQGGPSPKTAEK